MGRRPGAHRPNPQIILIQVQGLQGETLISPRALFLFKGWWEEMGALWFLSPFI